MTLTIEVPDDLAAALSELPEAERNHYAVALMRAGWQANDDAAAMDADEIDEEAVAAIAEGLADMEAGRLLTIEQVDANIEAVLATLRREQERTPVESQYALPTRSAADAAAS